MTQNISAAAQAIVDSLDDIAELANHGTGCSYELFVANVWGLVGTKVRGLSPEDKAAVYAVVRQGYGDPGGYKDYDCCHHGFSDDCPCGCFENDDYESWDYYNYVEPEPSYERKLLLIYYSAKIDLCKQLITAYSALGENEFAVQHIERLKEELAELFDVGY